MHLFTQKVHAKKLQLVLSCVQVWNPDSPEDEVLAMVCRTGLNTVMGAMVKELLAPLRLHHEKNPLLPVCCLRACYCTLASVQFCIPAFQCNTVKRVDMMLASSWVRSARLPACLPACPPARLPACLPVCLSVCARACVRVCVCVCLLVCLRLCMCVWSFY